MVGIEILRYCNILKKHFAIVVIVFLFLQLQMNLSLAANETVISVNPSSQTVGSQEAV